MGRGKRRGSTAAQPRPQAIGNGATLIGASSAERVDVGRVRAALPGCDDLRRAPWAGSANPAAGHCYIACEVLYHLWGGKEAGWVPQGLKHEGGPHWFLKNKLDGRVVDPTSDQFQTPVPYAQARGMGFLTREPSKRARVLAERAGITL